MYRTSRTSTRRSSEEVLPPLSFPDPKKMLAEIRRLLPSGIDTRCRTSETVIPHIRERLISNNSSSSLLHQDQCIYSVYDPLPADGHCVLRCIIASQFGFVRSADSAEIWGLRRNIANALLANTNSYLKDGTLDLMLLEEQPSSNDEDKLMLWRLSWAEFSEKSESFFKYAGVAALLALKQFVYPERNIVIVSTQLKVPSPSCSSSTEHDYHHLDLSFFAVLLQQCSSIETIWLAESPLLLGEAIGQRRLLPLL
jgi:hypothetical protein